VHLHFSMILPTPPPKQAHTGSTVFDPRQEHVRDASEPPTRPKVYRDEALPVKPNGIVTGHAEQTGACTNHGAASNSHRTFLHAALRTDIPLDSIHITGPSQCPRVDEPHPAPIA
jgi:hypothetical protein